MRKTAVAVTLAAMSLSGCSSTNSLAQIASTASVAINGADVKAPVVKCYQQEWFRTIEIGDTVSGATVRLDERKESVSLESVRIQNLGGFTGMYSHDNPDSKAEATLNNGALTVKGSAAGYRTDKPNEPANADFRITARC
jgi:outer membrane lipoprotein SlyB